jgi:surface antigen
MRYNGQINSKNRTQAERRTLMKKKAGGRGKACRRNNGQWKERKKRSNKMK